MLGWSLAVTRASAKEIGSIQGQKVHKECQYFPILQAFGRMNASDGSFEPYLTLALNLIVGVTGDVRF